MSAKQAPPRVQALAKAGAVVARRRDLFASVNRSDLNDPTQRAALVSACDELIAALDFVPDAKQPKPKRNRVREVIAEAGDQLDPRATFDEDEDALDPIAFARRTRGGSD